MPSVLLASIDSFPLLCTTSQHFYEEGSIFRFRLALFLVDEAGKSGQGRSMGGLGFRV